MPDQRERIDARPYDFIEFRRDELGLSVEDLRGLPWVRAKVARIRAGRLGIRIEFGPYVGRVEIPGRYIIDLRELVPGTVAALAPLAAGGRRWMETEVGVGQVTVDPWTQLARIFTHRLVDYVRSGVRPLYVPVQFESDRPRGQINIRRSAARHWSRGHLSMASSDVRFLTDDTALNRLALAASVRAEHLLRDDATALLELRTALRALAGVVLQPSPDVRAARAIVEPDFADMVELANLIVSGVSALPEDLDVEEQVVNVWFNVATIFEAAMRTLVAECCPSGTVRSGRGDGVTLFRPDSEQEGDGAPAADPDIVIETPAAVAVLDAKYRSAGVDVGRDELYQLIAHANAYGARHAALIVPRLASRDESRYLGVDTVGRTYDVIVVDADDPFRARGELVRWLAQLGLAAPPTEPAAPELLRAPA
jgi:hypothetical protein